MKAPFARKAALINVAVGIALMLLGSAAIVQVDSTYVAFQAELGSLDDDPTNGSKFDVMAPESNSFGDVLIADSTAGEISFNVELSDNTLYTVYLRYRETGLTATPGFELLLEGSSIATSKIYVSPDPNYSWVHSPGMDLMGTPGTPQSLTLRNTAGTDYRIDSIAIVNRADVIAGFVVDDSTITQFSIPEPSSSSLLLLGILLLARRRRA